MSKKFDYTKYSKEEPIEVSVPNTNEVETYAPKDRYGVVVDCAKLNIREQPSTESEVVGQIDASTELVIQFYEDEEDSAFYKICTVSGIEGYCMKRYIRELP